MLVIGKNNQSFSSLIILFTQQILKIYCFDCDNTEECVKIIKNRHTQIKDVKMYRYSQSTIENLLALYDFKLMSCLNFSAAAIANEPADYKAYAVQKISR